MTRIQCNLVAQPSTFLMLYLRTETTKPVYRHTVVVESVPCERIDVSESH